MSTGATTLIRVVVLIRSVLLGPTGYAGAALLAPMHTMWRECQKNGGSPDFIRLRVLTFVKSFEIAAIDSAGGMSRYAVQPGSSERTLELWTLQ